MASQNKKIKGKLFEELFEPVLVKNIENSAQVESREDKPYIGTCPFYSSLSHYVVKIPLSFNYAERMLNDGLPQAV